MAMASDDGRRILVPIDILGVDRATLAALVVMAERLESGLLGLILEDDALHRAAALPFVREVLASGGGEREMVPDELRRQARRLARSVQQALTELAARRSIVCQFEVVAASGSRILSAWSYREHDLYLPPRTPVAGRGVEAARELHYRRVRLLYQTGPDSARAVEILHRIARNGHTREVFVVTDTGVPRAVLDSLKAQGLRVHLEVFHDSLEEHLKGVLARPACDLLIIPRSLFGEAPEFAVDAALNRVSRPVLLVSA